MYGITYLEEWKVWEGQMEGWLDELMDGWIDVWMNGRMVREKYE